jgi:hypothetical protein
LVIALLNQLAAQVKLRTSIHIEQSHRRSSGGRETDNASLCFDCEVVIPTVLARIEEINAVTGGGVDAGKVARFVKITLRATPGKIGRLIRAAMNAGDDVIDMKWPLVGSFGQTAILATIARSLAHKLSRRSGHTSARIPL